MPKPQKANTPPQPSSYELLAGRLQRAVNSPPAQASKSALLERFPDDKPDDWERILEEIAENENVTVAHRDDGNVQLFWTVPAQD